MRAYILPLAAAAMLAAAPVFAQQPDHAAHHPEGASAPAAADASHMHCDMDMKNMSAEDMKKMHDMCAQHMAAHHGHGHKGHTHKPAATDTSKDQPH